MTKKKISTIRRVLGWIGLTVVLIVLFFVAIASWVLREESNYQLTAVPYLLKVVPEIAKWDPDTAWNHYSPDVKKTVTRAENEKVINFLSRLGKLEDLGNPQFMQVSTFASVGQGSQKLVYYSVPAKFENGEASISIAISDNHGRFTIHSFRVISPALIESSPSDSPTPKEDE